MRGFHHHILIYSMHQHGCIARRFFLKNIGDGRNNDAAAADLTQFTDGLGQVITTHDDCHRIPVLVDPSRTPIGLMVGPCKPPTEVCVNIF